MDKSCTNNGFSESDAVLTTFTQIKMCRHGGHTTEPLKLLFFKLKVGLVEQPVTHYSYSVFYVK